MKIVNAGGALHNFRTPLLFDPKGKNCVSPPWESPIAELPLRGFLFPLAGGRSGWGLRLSAYAKVQSGEDRECRGSTA
jgi:hypothetical protein